MLRVFTHTVISKFNKWSIDAGSIAARIIGPRIGRAGAISRISSKNVSPYCGAFPGLTMMRCGSVLLRSKWTTPSFNLASKRRNLPIANRKFCACRLNLNPGLVKGYVAAASFATGHNPYCKDTHTFSFFFAAWCPLHSVGTLCMCYVWIMIHTTHKIYITLYFEEPSWRVPKTFIMHYGFP